jgi:hypothetical protein
MCWFPSSCVVCVQLLSFSMHTCNIFYKNSTHTYTNTHTPEFSSSGHSVSPTPARISRPYLHARKHHVGPRLRGNTLTHAPVGRQRFDHSLCRFHEPLRVSQRCNAFFGERRVASACVRAFKVYACRVEEEGEVALPLILLNYFILQILWFLSRKSAFRRGMRCLRMYVEFLRCNLFSKNVHACMCRILFLEDCVCVHVLRIKHQFLASMLAITSFYLLSDYFFRIKLLLVLLLAAALLIIFLN